MKSNKVMIAALLVAALMILPIALVTSNDDAAADPDPSPFDISSMFSGLMGLDPSSMQMMESFGKLAGAMGYTPVTPTEKKITTDLVYESNQILKLDSNFVFDGGSITMKAGSAVVFCVAQPFSISAEALSAITSEENSTFYIVNTLDGVTDVTYIKNHADTIVIDSKTAEADDTVYYKGSFNYDMKLDTGFNINATVTIAEGTTITDNKDLAKAKNMVEFLSENSISVKVTPTVDTEKTAYDATVGVKADIKDTTVDGTVKHNITIKGEGDYTAKASVPQMAGDDKKMTASAEGDIKLTLGVDDYTATFKNSVDFSMEEKKYGMPNAETTYSGSISFSIDYGKLEITNDDGSVVEMKGLYASVKAKFSDKDIELSISGGVDKIGMTDKNGVESYIQDVDIDLSYTAEIKSFSMPSLTSLAASVTPKPKWADTAMEYLNGIEAGTVDKSVKEYASEFFMGKIDSLLQVDNFATGKSLKADLSVGKFVMEGDVAVYIESLELKAEISKSVGVSASASVGKVIFASGSTKYMIQPASVSIDTYTGEDKKYVFECDFNITGEMKQFMSGRLVSNPFFNSFRGTLDLGAKMVNLKAEAVTDIVEMKADEITLNSYGIDMSAKNLNYDVEKKLFELSTIEISGYYYGGDSMVKEVNGAYNNVTFDLGASTGMTFANLTAESVEVTFTDIYNNELTVSSHYDATQAALVCEYESDGQYWLFDTFDDNVLMATMGSVKYKDAPEDPARQFIFGGNVIINNMGTTESPTDDTDYTVIIDGKNATLRYWKLGPVVEGGFTGTVYVTCDSLGPYAHKTYVKVNGTSYALDKIEGAALGITVDKDGNVTYSIISLAGNKLGTETTPTGFTMGEIKDEKADVTITGTTLRYIASPQVYKIIIDGKTAKEDVPYRSNLVTVEDLGKDVIMLVDKNGKMYGNVVDGTWTLFQYLYTYDLDLTSVKAKEIAEVSKTEVNNVDGSAATFTMPTGLTAPLKFKMISNVQFSIAQGAVAGGQPVEIAAQETTFDGKKAFIIKASSDGSNIEATFLIPVSNVNSKVMHVDEYGRVAEQASKIVKIGDEQFIQVTTNDYSIFYVDSDQPRYNTGGGSDNMLLFVAIGAVVAVFVVAGVFFFVKKH